MNAEIIKETTLFAKRIRLGIMRQIEQTGFGHVGGTLSISDAVAVLYNGVMKIDPQNPKWEERDRLVVSKGHAGPVIYAALALKGFFPMDWLMTLNQGGTKLPSHLDGKKTPGIDISTGSLGQGLSIALGMAYSFKLDKRENLVYAIVGDGECDEGQIWEAAMAASKFQLDNLCCLVDYNKYQQDSSIEEVMPLGDIAQKFRAFGWHAIQIDGHNIAAIFQAFEEVRQVKQKPCVIILDTQKGYGDGYTKFSDIGSGCHHMRMTKDEISEAVAHFEKSVCEMEKG